MMKSVSGVLQEQSRVLLNSPGGGGGAGQSMPDGRRPEPGGWNRIQIEVDDLEGMVESLRKTGVQFRNEIVTAAAASRSCSRIQPATPSNCSSRRRGESALSSAGAMYRAPTPSRSGCEACRSSMTRARPHRQPRGSARSIACHPRLEASTIGPPTGMLSPPVDGGCAARFHSS